MSKLDPNYQEVDGVVLLGKAAAPRVYADGVSQLLLGFPMTSIAFHQVAEPPGDETEGKEMRKIAVIVTMPTLALAEAVQNILTGLKAGAEQIAGFQAGANDQLQKLLSQVTINEEPK